MGCGVYPLIFGLMVACVIIILTAGDDETRSEPDDHQPLW